MISTVIGTPHPPSASLLQSLLLITIARFITVLPRSVALFPDLSNQNDIPNL